MHVGADSAGSGAAAPSEVVPEAAGDILKFWFGDWATSEHLGPDQMSAEMVENRPMWFRKSEELDGQVREKFSGLIEGGRQGQLAGWEATPRGSLALTVLLDQFSRNVFRGQPESFQADPSALQVAQRAVAGGFDRKLPMPMRVFFYLPYMHSEDPEVVSRCVDLFTKAKEDSTNPSVRDFVEPFRHFAVEHRDVVLKFGRFPSRNAILNRISTPEELEYLRQGGGF